MRPNARWIDYAYILFALALRIPFGLLGSIPQGLGLTEPAPDATYFMMRNLYNWGSTVEPYLLSGDVALDFRHIMDGLVSLPLTMVIVYGLWRRKNWVRLLAWISAGIALPGMTQHVYTTYATGNAPLDLTQFWLVNAPYLIFPALLALRMWQPSPYDTEEMT